MNNRQEFLAGTVPTNIISALRLLAPHRSGASLAITWQSVTNRAYYVQRADNLSSTAPFQIILGSNIVGRSATTTYTDTNANGAGPYFYRVGVEP